MKKLTKGLVALSAASVLALGACGGGSSSSEPARGATTGSSEAGFPADSTIGVSLPWLGTQNWSEAKDLFEKDLAAAGFKAAVNQADNKVPDQQKQIETMVEQGAKVLVVGPIDGTQLGTVLESAKEQGVYVIGYDRAIENTDAVDAIVQFDSIETGKLQGQALLDGLAARKGSGPYNIELFAGGPADPNAPLFFQGAMEILQPKIDDGTLVVVSGQTSFEQAAIQDWDNGKAQTRMETLLAGFYSDKQVDGVLVPNDGIARAVLTAAEAAGQTGDALPVVDGLDAENESITSIWEGKQYATIAKPTQDLVSKTIEVIQQLQKGEELSGSTSTFDNGVKEVPVFGLTPTIITKDNIKKFFANDPDRLALLS